MAVTFMGGPLEHGNLYQINELKRISGILAGEKPVVGTLRGEPARLEFNCPFCNTSISAVSRNEVSKCKECGSLFQWFHEEEAPSGKMLMIDYVREEDFNPMENVYGDS